MKKILLILFAAVMAMAACESKKPAADIEKKVDETLAQLSLQEKIKLIHAPRAVQIQQRRRASSGHSHLLDLGRTPRHPARRPLG